MVLKKTLIFYLTFLLYDMRAQHDSYVKPFPLFFVHRVCLDDNFI